MAEYKALAATEIEDSDRSAKTQSVFEGTDVDTVFITEKNTVRPRNPIVYSNNSTMSFPSNEWGKDAVFYINSSSQFVREVIVSLTVKFSSDNAAAILNDYAVYAAIESIKFRVGGSNQITYEGSSLVPIVLEQCESEEKKRDVLELAGAYTPASTTSVLNGATRTFSALLPLPWSSLATINKMKPLPIYMISGNIEVIVKLRAAGVAFNSTSTLSSAYFQVNSGRLVDESKRPKIKTKNGEIFAPLRYPFIEHQTFSRQFRSTVASGKASASIDLMSFPNANVTQFTIEVLDSGGGYYYGLMLENIVLKLNSNIIYETRTSTGRLWDLINDTCPQRHGMKRYAVGGNISFSLTDNNKQITNYGGGNIRRIDKDGNWGGDVLATNTTDTACGKIGVYGYYLGTGGTGNSTTAEIYEYTTIPMAEVLSKWMKQDFFEGVNLNSQTLNLSFDIMNSGQSDGDGTFVINVIYDVNAAYLLTETDSVHIKYK